MVPMKSINGLLQSEERPARRPLLFRPSVSMSLQLVIPWRVALQQSSPSLRQPTEILKQRCWFEKEIYSTASVANRNCLNQGVHPMLLCLSCDRSTEAVVLS